MILGEMGGFSEQMVGAEFCSAPLREGGKAGGQRVAMCCDCGGLTLEVW